MMKLFIFCSIFAVSLAGIIHDEEPMESETDHHHQIDHEHATSHQSFKIHHFHAVPVYVKHEDHEYLKHPVEVGGVNHKLKVLHPKTEHSHSHGLTLENHTEEKDYVIHGHDSHDGSHNHQYETIEHSHESEGGSIGLDGGHHFSDVTVHHGHGGI